MNLTAAQNLILDLCENANFGRDYKAPHANRGTPARPHAPRRMRRRMVFMKLKGEIGPDGKPKGENVMCKPRLFKGWRP